MDDAGRGGQHARNVEIGTPGQQQKQRGDQESQMTSGLVTNDEPARRVECERPGDNVGSSRPD